jgi:hypothetical protein
VSRPRVRVAALAAVVLFGAACGSSAVKPVARVTPRPSVLPRPNPKPKRVAVVPMVLETAAPLRPPILELVVDSGGHEVVQRGVLYIADFATRLAQFERYSKFPVPWSAPSTVEVGSTAALEFDTDIAPDDVMVKSYSVVDSFDGIPVAEVKPAFGCKRFALPRCKFTKTDGGLRILDLGPAVFTGGYIAVFVVWHVPSKDQSAVANPTDSVTGSWLFRIETKPRVGASPS